MKNPRYKVRGMKGYRDDYTLYRRDHIFFLLTSMKDIRMSGRPPQRP